MSLCLEKLCRTCMEEAPTILSLFDTVCVSVSPDSPSILDKLGTFTALPVIPNDGLPENICVSCIGSLNEAYNFKQKIEFSEAKLKMYLDQIAVKHEQIILSPDDVAEERYVIRCGECNLIFKQDVFATHLETHNKVQGGTFSLETKLEEESIPSKLEDESLPSSPQPIEYLNSDTNEDNKTEVCENEDNECMTTVIEAFGGFSEEEDNAEACDEDIEGNTSSTIINENEIKRSENSEESSDEGSQTKEFEIMSSEHSEIKEDQQQQDKIMKYKCSKCTARFSESNLRNRHQSSQKCALACHECEICQKIYSRHRAVREHMINVHHMKIKCMKCSAKFDNLKLLYKHEQTHGNEKEKVIFKCAKCRTQFPDANSHDEHRKENKCAECEFCKKRFRVRSDMISHMAETHEKKLKCSECIEEFTKLRDLIRHTSKHKKENRSSKDNTKQYYAGLPRLCPICGKSFTTTGNLTIHLRRHNNIKPFKCTLCDNAFVNNEDLKSHFRTHTGELPFVCEFCGAAFRATGERSKHRRIHTGEKPYECNICKRRFLALNTLKEHRKTHTGERPYACPICDRKFARPNDMKKHTLVHSSTKPYICTICSAGFRQPTRLRAHMRTHQASDSAVSQVEGAAADVNAESSST